MRLRQTFKIYKQFCNGKRTYKDRGVKKAIRIVTHIAYSNYQKTLSLCDCRPKNIYFPVQGTTTKTYYFKEPYK